MQTRLWWRPLCDLTEFAIGWSMASDGRFCVGAFGRNVAPVTVKMFSHLFYIIKKFYKCCTVNAVCKDNAVINYITV
jgi:hypothetical protein